MLVVVITGKRSIKIAIFIISLIISISTLFMSIVGTNIKKVFRNKLVEILIGARVNKLRNTNKVATSQGLKGEINLKISNF